MTLSGIMPLLLTPMVEDGSPDPQGMIRLLDHLRDHPMAGYFVLGSVGEGFNLPYRHRLDVAKTVSRHVGGRRYLIVGAGSPILEEIYQFFDDTADLPIDSYHVIATDRKMNTAFTVDYFSEIADRSPHPVWIYSNPVRALGPSLDAVRVLAEHPNIAGMKAGGFDLSTIVALAALNSETFQVLGAGGSNLLAYLAYGVTCVTMSTATCFPGEYARIHDLWRNGRVDAARKDAVRMNRVFAALPPRRNTESSAEDKAILELLGVCRRWVCPPFRPVGDDDLRAIREVLVSSGLL